MPNCRDTLAFLDAVRTRNVTAPIAGPDFQSLQQLGLVQSLSADDYAGLQKEVEGLASARDAIVQDGAAHARLAGELQRESMHTRSILFHFENQQRRDAELAQEAATQNSLAATDADLGLREQAFAQLSAKRSLLDALSPYSGGFVALSGLGAMAVRDLGVAMYRAADDPFPTYWARAQEVNRELDDLANQAAGFMTALTGPLPGVDPSYLWAIAIGLAKSGGDRTTKVPTFLSAYQLLRPIAHNAENQLMSAEVLANSDAPVAENLDLLRRLDENVQGRGVPEDSSLGVASILMIGRRADGSFADGNLAQALSWTHSYESAALLAVVNAPFPELAAKFTASRQMFLGWGYEPSEDVDLSAAYLAVSDLPTQGIGTKLGIIAKSLGTYLRYPLVGASILASIPVLEANETLNVLEKAYETLGRRTGPLSQPELICLAVRLLHGIQVATVNELDPTAPAPVGAPAPVFAAAPRMFFVPMIVTHGYYFSTFSGIGGVHPGHVHGWGGYTG